MRGFLKRTCTPIAVILLAGGIEYGVRLEPLSKVGSYYRELGARPDQLNRFERAIFSVLLAAGDKLQKNKS